MGVDEALQRARPTGALDPARQGAPTTPLVEATAAAPSEPLEPSVLLSVGGAPPVPVPRTELAQWAAGAADDWGAADPWAWMAAAPAVPGGGAGQARSSRRRKRR